MEYKIIHHFNKERLSNAVNEALEKDWELCGSLAVAGNGVDTRFYQAMIKRK